jgi:hypothetical protein
MRDLKILFLLFGALGLFSLFPAQASTIFTLTQDACTGTCGTAPFGTILLTQTTATVVTVTETLKAGEVFAGTGAGNSLGFNVVGAATALGDISAGFSVGLTNTKFSSFGTFLYSIACNDCQGGHPTNPAGPLSFTVSRATGITITDFTNNTGGFYFASDITGTNGKTGNVASMGGGPVTTTATPEPVSIVLSGAGLMAIGLVGLRPRKASGSASASATIA